MEAEKHIYRFVCISLLTVILPYLKLKYFLWNANNHLQIFGFHFLILMSFEEAKHDNIFPRCLHCQFPFSDHPVIYFPPFGLHFATAKFSPLNSRLLNQYTLHFGLVRAIIDCKATKILDFKQNQLEICNFLYFWKTIVIMIYNHHHKGTPTTRISFALSLSLSLSLSFSLFSLPLFSFSLSLSLSLFSCSLFSHSLSLFLSLFSLSFSLSLFSLFLSLSFPVSLSLFHTHAHTHTHTHHLSLLAIS